VGNLSDVAAERAVLAGTASSGDAFLDVSFSIQSNTFTDETNQILWTLIKSLRDENANINIDMPLLRSKAKELDLDHIVEDPNELNYIRVLLQSTVEPTNVRRFAAIIRKLEIARLLDAQLEEAQIDIRQIKGNETIDSIISLAENKIFDFTSLLMDSQEAGVVHISDGALEYFEYLLNNERDIIGLSTGYPIWDSILGGLRRKTVNMLGARSNVGKSFWADNIALHVAGKLNIPTLYLDTEMSKDGHWHRLWAHISGVPSKEIENGKFARNEIKKRQVKNAVDHINNIPYHYVDISGKAFEEILAYVRRWIIKEVGYDENGKTKDCLIIYDYLKMMSSGGLSNEMKEYQIMGFQMTGLHNFAVKFDVPVLSFVQLNRDGIDKESTDTISQSDRIVWLASSLSIYKPKSDDELAANAAEGNRKLIVVKNRYGPVNTHGEYINYRFDGSIARIEEGRLSSEVPIEPRNNKKSKGGGFETDEDDSPVEFHSKEKFDKLSRAK
jgi:replicative DNA helicase